MKQKKEKAKLYTWKATPLGLFKSAHKELILKFNAERVPLFFCRLASRRHPSLHQIRMPSGLIRVPASSSREN